MIQLNLLPDVKIAYIKARAQKRLVILGSFIAAAASLAIFIILFVYVQAVQTKSISDLTKDISKSSTELSSTKDLDKILTVQNQLASLDALHDQKPALDRLPQFIAVTTPEGVRISSLNLDFASSTVLISGKTDKGLSGVNSYIDTLKAAKFITSDDAKNVKIAFNDVVLSSFSKDTDASFSISFSFDPIIFVSTNNVVLSVIDPTAAQPADFVNDNAFSVEGEQ